MNARPEPDVLPGSGRPLHRLAGAIVLLLLSLPSCSTDVPEDDAATTDPTLLPARADYRTHCGACHGTSGRGAPHLFPPLRGASWVNADPGLPIRVILHGLEGPVSVGGERYMNRMFPLGHRLSDEQVARILTYVRASWGNRSSPVTAAEVRRIRDATADRSRPWTASELETLPDGSGREEPGPG